MTADTLDEIRDFPDLRLQVSELQETPNNPRTHDAEQVEAIADSILRFGWTNPMLVAQEDDDRWRILAGHGRKLAALKLGIDSVPCRDLSDLSLPERMALVIADNRLAELAGWHEPSMAAIFEELNQAGMPLEATGYAQEVAEEIMKAARTQPGDDDGHGGQAGEDDFGEITAKPITRAGDLWQLGPHRLFIGDSLKAGDVDTLLDGEQIHLIATDPPYAIYGSSTGMASDIADDKMIRPFFAAITRLALERLPWFGHFYVFCDWRSWATWWLAAQETSGLEVKNLLVWDKGGAGLGSNYANTHEMIGFMHKLPKQTAMGNRPAGIKPVHRPNVLRHSRPSGAEREHNAAKPVALMRELIENSTGPGDVVLDPFCGSGSTLIAADQLDRVCCTMEIEPGWAEVTLNRFERLRETEPELIASLDEVAGPLADVRQSRGA